MSARRFSVRTLQRAVCALALFPAVVAAQSSGTVAYFDRSAFEAALSGRTDLSLYGSAGPSGSTSYSDATPLVLGGLTVAGPGFTVVSQSAVDRGRPATLSPQNAPANRVTLSFATPITAFGADYLPNSATATQDFVLDAPELGGPVTVETSETGWRFFGIMSSTPFSFATIDTDAPIVYDRPTIGGAGAPQAQRQFGVAFAAPAFFVLPYATTTATPEPATIALVAGGLLVLGAARTRARRR